MNESLRQAISLLYDIVQTHRNNPDVDIEDILDFLYTEGIIDSDENITSYGEENLWE